MTNTIIDKKLITKNEKPKVLYIEIMRIIAIFFVIFNHTRSDGYLLFSDKPVDSLSFWIYLIPAIFCRFSIYLFLAISGALLLSKDSEPIRKIWIKRIPKFLIVLILVSLFYYISYFKTFNLKDFLIRFFTNPNGIRAHIWYLYLYLSFLVCLPFIRAMVKNLENKHYYYMVAIAFVSGSVLPILEYFILTPKNLTLNPNFDIAWIGSKIIFYPCIGYFLFNKFKTKNPKLLLTVLWIINIITIGISCILTSILIKRTPQLNEDNVQFFFLNFTFINCFTIFLTIKYLFENVKFNRYVERFILSLSSCTFFIYLSHVWIKELDIMQNLLKTIKSTGCNAMVAAFIWSIIIMALSYLLSLIVSKIPIIKKLFF